MNRIRRKRSNAYGRLYSVAGGAPNRPIVSFAGDASWLREEEAYFMKPQAIAFRRAFSKTGDVSELLEWMRIDLENWRADSYGRANAPVLVAVETSQSPHLFRVISDSLYETEPNALAVGYRLRTGDQNPREEITGVTSGAIDVGGNWLSSWFDAIAPSHPPDGERHGRPYVHEKIAVSFDTFQSEEAPGLGRAAVRSSLSAAESLRVKALASHDLAMSLNANESLAAAIMLSLLVADQRRPSVAPPNLGDDAWASGPLPRGLRGVA